MINGKCRLDAEMKEPFEIKNVYVMIPEGPGLGIELIDDIAEVFPFQGSYGRFCLDTDGSVVDR